MSKIIVEEMSWFWQQRKYWN